MEALAAVSLCGNIVQFAEFGFKTFRAAKEIIDHGQLDNDAHIIQHAIRLVEVNDGIIHGCNGFLLKFQQDLDDAGGEDTDSLPASLSQGDVLLRAVAQDCQTIASQLRDRLSSLAVPSSNGKGGTSARYRKKWTAFYHALLRMWDQTEIDAMTSQLEQAKSVVQSAILASISSKVDMVMIQQSHKFQSLGDDNRALVTSLLQKQDDTIRMFKSEIAALSIILSNTQMALATIPQHAPRLVADALSPQVGTSDAAKTSPSLSMYAVREKSTRQAISEEMIKSLRFPAIRSRYESVEDAHSDTFHWIYEDPTSGDGPSSGRIWSDFSSWLRGDEGLYWITGKPASGKSTLMKYIAGNPRTVRLLQESARSSSREDGLCISTFFFWLSGTRDQRSQRGLLRSILFDVLTKFPWLLPTVFPEEWAERYCHKLNPPAKHRDEIENWDWRGLAYMDFSWSIGALKAAITRLATQTQYPLQLCLLVDGLDEYEGDETEIANFFAHISRSPNVKCCVSSRPLQPFIDAFGAVPTVRIHDFTKPDIERFVADRLDDDVRWGPIARAAPDRASALKRDLVDSAKGVFLWVRLVVHSLLRGLGNRDGIGDLQVRLREIPKELEDLYGRMITGVDETYRVDSSRIFRLVHTAADLNGPFTELTLLQMALAMDTSIEAALTSTPDSLTQKQVDKESQDMAYKVISRCGGLLDVQKQVSMEDSSPGLEVSYLHRTVKEYLQQRGTQTTLQHWAGQSTIRAFLPLESVYAAYIIDLNLALNDRVCISPAHAPQDTIRCAMRCLAVFQNDDAFSLEKLVLLCNRAFALVERLSWEKETVGTTFPPRRSRQMLAVEFGLHRYLQHLLDQAGPSKTMSTWLEAAVTLTGLVDDDSLADQDHVAVDATDGDKTIRVLIRHGADIDVAWARWLQFHSVREAGSGRGPAHWKARLQLFLRHGAAVTRADLDVLLQRMPEYMRNDILASPSIMSSIMPASGETLTRPSSSLPPIQGHGFNGTLSGPEYGSQPGVIPFSQPPKDYAARDNRRRSRIKAKAKDWLGVLGS